MTIILKTMTKTNALQELKALSELKDLTKNAKKPGEPCSSPQHFTVALLISLRIQGIFWQMLDKDFKRKVDNESIHDIFYLVFNELDEKQLINILHKIDPKGLSKILKSIKEVAK